MIVLPTKVNPLFYKMKRQNIDFSIFNWGGIRTEIPEGDITTRTAFEVMPFENRLLIVELTGYKLYEMADFFGIDKENLKATINKFNETEHRLLQQSLCSCMNILFLSLLR